MDSSARASIVKALSSRLKRSVTLILMKPDLTIVKIDASPRIPVLYQAIMRNSYTSELCFCCKIEGFFLGTYLFLKCVLPWRKLKLFMNQLTAIWQLVLTTLVLKKVGHWSSNYGQWLAFKPRGFKTIKRFTYHHSYFCIVGHSKNKSLFATSPTLNVTERSIEVDFTFSLANLECSLKS